MTRTLRPPAYLAATLAMALLAALTFPAAAAAGPTRAPAVVASHGPAFHPSDYGLVDPSQGIWYLRNSEGETASFFYGNPGDFPIMGDWDCDGDDTPGMYRQSDGFVYLRNSNSTGIGDIRFFFGDPSDVPLAGDFNGDGCDTVSIYRPSVQQFFIINELGQDEGGLGEADYFFTFGNPSDKPVVGDWDGDGVDEVGLHRESTGFFYFRNTLSTGIADGEFFFGDPDDRFVAGDWGIVDGKDTPAIFRPSDARFYLRYTNTQGNADEVRTMGDGPWLPVAGVFGPLVPRVSVSLSNAPAGLANAVAGLYSWNGAAWGIPAGLRAHLASLGFYPPPGSLAGTARTGTVKGAQVAVVTVGSDLIVAIKHAAGWKVAGARLTSRGKAAWFGGVRHVLVLGADQPGDDTNLLDNNADSVHILSGDAGRGRGAVTGIPRDTFVDASYGLDKIAVTMRDKLNGQAFGPATTLGAARTMSGLPVEGYMVTGFPGFRNLVNDYGGLTATIPYPIPKPPANPPLSAGTHQLDGAQALAVARERQTLPSGDVDRQLDGGLLINAALAKAKPMGTLSIPALLDLLDDHVITDLSAEALLTLAATAFSLGTPDNVVIEGNVTSKVIRGAGTFGFELSALNRTTFTDLADGLLDPGRCAVTNNPSAHVACWKRP